MPDEFNPYASPAASDRDDLSSDVGEGVRLRSGLLFRRVWLPPPVGAVLEYNGKTIGYEIVKVAGLVVARRWSWLWFVPRFDFVLQTEQGPLPVVLCVEIDSLLRVRRMTIDMDDVRVYEERRGG